MGATILSPTGLGALIPPPPSPTDPRDLRSVCREFEGLLLGVLLRQMCATVSGAGLLPASTGREVFEELWAQEVARVAARGGPLGLADQIERSLTPALEDSSESALKPAGRTTEEMTVRRESAVDGVAGRREDR